MKRVFQVAALAAVAVALSVTTRAQSVGLPIDLPSLLQLVGVGAVPALVTVSLLSTVASIFVAVTPTPHPGTAWGRVYQFVELLAMVTRNTKETGIPLVDMAHAEARAMFDRPAQNAGGAGASATAAALLVALVIPALLTGCLGSTSTPVTTSAQIPAPAAVQASLITGLGSFDAGLQKAVGNVNAGIAAAGPVLKYACGGASFANTLFSLVAPMAGASAADVADEGKAMAALETLCSTSPTDITTAAATGLALYTQIKGKVAAASPSTAMAVAQATATAVAAPGS